MNILTEISELADQILAEFVESGFFEENVFIHPLELKRRMEIQMQYNWEQIDNMYLTEDQLIDIVGDAYRDGFRKALDIMYSDELLIADSINKDGELVYKINPKINLDDYLQSKFRTN
jgi:hypothetical protein